MRIVSVKPLQAETVMFFFNGNNVQSRLRKQNPYFSSGEINKRSTYVSRVLGKGVSIPWKANQGYSQWADAYISLTLVYLQIDGRGVTCVEHCFHS